MGIQKNCAVQSVLYRFVDVEVGDLQSGEEAEAIDLPPGSILLGGFVTVTEPFNSGTSDSIKVGSDGEDDRYASSIGADSTNHMPMMPSGYVQEGGPLTVTWTGSGSAATEGKFRVAVQYIIEGRASASHG